MFPLDYGFVHGTDFSTKNNSGHIGSSLDGYNSYLFIEDHTTWYTWRFLSTDKSPPLSILPQFLSLHGNQTESHCILWDNKGRKLWKSNASQQVAQTAGHLLESTAADAPFQNHVAKHQNSTLGQIMFCLLHSTRLVSLYWSFALQHTVYYKNSLPHSATNKTLLKLCTGVCPSGMQHLIFRCCIFAHHPGDIPAKLDYHMSHGILLRYTATATNVYYQDINTKGIKIATHDTFNKANMSFADPDIPDLSYNIYVHRSFWQYYWIFHCHS